MLKSQVKWSSHASYNVPARFVLLTKEPQMLIIASKQSHVTIPFSFIVIIIFEGVFPSNRQP